MGLFTIPSLRRSPDGILGLLLGIFLGPLGIIITGVVAGHKNTWVVGIIQFVVTLLTVGLGYFWSLIHGILIFVKSS